MVIAKINEGERLMVENNLLNQRKMETAIEEAKFRVYKVGDGNKPKGYCDRAGRWYPSESEWCPECDSVRKPTRNYPWSIYKHCYSIKHIALSHGVDPSLLKKELRPFQRGLRVMQKLIESNNGRG